MIVRSPEPPIEVPDVPLTPLLLERADALGDKPALIDGPSGRTYTYAQFAAAVRAAAAGFARRGLLQGDVLAIFSPNLPEYAIAFHGANAFCTLRSAGRSSGKWRTSTVRMSFCSIHSSPSGVYT